jgi:enhancing lycopene biosynthesis protein 2
MNKKVLVLLAGCGHKDGSEIRESVLTLLNLDKAGLSYDCASLDKKQAHVLDFISDQEISEERNMLTESARIARGDIKDLAKVDLTAYAALVIPGGFGVAKNFCDFAFKGIEASVVPQIKHTINSFYTAAKPIVAICIAPALVALSLKDESGLKAKLKLTLGTADSDLETLAKLGCEPKSCQSSEAIIDNENKVISTPAYMHAEASLKEIDQGISLALESLADSLKETNSKPALSEV